MTTIKEYSGVVALVILAIMGLSGFVKGNSFGSATACTDGYTCVTNLETQGNSIVDGTSAFTGAATFSGAVTQSGALAASSTLQVTGASTFYSTSTLNSNLVITTSNSATSSIQVGCIQTTATSTATPVHFSLTISQTASTTFDGTGRGNVMWSFGKCPGV